MRKKITLKWLKVHPEAQIPQYNYKGDAGFDFVVVEKVVLLPGQRKIARTGLKVEIPEGYELQIRPRSGMSLNSPLLIANSPGTIDSNYRGEIGIILYNSSNRQYVVKKGTRIAQGVVVELPEVTHIEVDSLSETERAEKGFGSTGIHGKKE